MRRMILLAMGLGLLGAALGCCHVAGVCDCETKPPPCGRFQATSAAPPTVQAEPVKASPKVIDK